MALSLAGSSENRLVILAPWWDAVGNSWGSQIECSMLTMFMDSWPQVFYCMAKVVKFTLGLIVLQLPGVISAYQDTNEQI